jgi:glycosyltransferase involved in cell wall biosynthesis
MAVLLRAGHYDLVFIQKELFPRLPDIFETVLHRRGVNFVLDFDDAIFVLYDEMKSPMARGLLQNKLPRVIARSRLVLAGNEFLADYARRFSKRVVRFPTVVDVERFKPANREPGVGGLPVVGWMGSPETIGFIENLRQALEGLARKAPFELRLIGAEPIPLEGVAVTSRPWSETSEVDELRQFDVGIMPLSASRWSQGKCSLKLLQYMGVGVASVSSPVGSACDIIRDGDNGFLAATSEEWVEKLDRLLHDPNLCSAVGKRGRETVVAEYSLQALGPQLAELLLEASGRPV